MAVIVLTDICSMNCKYCFYSEVLLQKRAEMLEKGQLPEKIKEKIFFDSKLIKKLADKLIDSETYENLGKKTVVITGGEPTLHPDFENLMNWYMSKGLNIHLLTNFSFQPGGSRAKFLQKHKKHFKFLVNLNEPSEQKNAVNTIQNLIDIDDDKIKIGLNIFHKDFNFDPLFEVLNNTKNIKIIRFGLPNPQVNEGISMGPLSEMKKMEGYENVLDIYTKDLFEEDINSIKETGQGIKYGMKQPLVFEYYQMLGQEVQKMVNRLRDEGFSDRIEFYVDCGFDMKIIPDDAVGFIQNRLYHKNPCSIPNGGDIMIGGRVDQCYTLLNWGNWSPNVNVNNYSIREVNSYYFISTVLLANGLLWPDLKWEMCRANSVRFFMQLFTKGKDGNGTFPIKDPNIVYLSHYPLKDLDTLIDTYISLYKEGKSVGLIRLLQLIEFLISSLSLKEALYVISKSTNIKMDNEMYVYRINYYRIITTFAMEIQAATIGKQYDIIQGIRDKYNEKLDTIRKSFNSKYGYLPEKHLEILDKGSEMIVKRWIFIE